MLRAALRYIYLTLCEQFHTPSLESITIHNLPNFYNFLPTVVINDDIDFKSFRVQEAANCASGKYSFAAAGPHHVLNFLLLLGLFVFGDKLLRNSGQLFKSKSTSFVVL